MAHSAIKQLEVELPSRRDGLTLELVGGHQLLLHGDDVLLATKVMVPTDGPVRAGVGLLGSPPMEISRTSTEPHSIQPLGK